MVQENIEICIQCQEGGCRSVREWSSFQKEIPDNRHSTSLIPVSPGRVLLQYSTAFLMFFTDMALSPSRLGILRFRTRISKYPARAAKFDPKSWVRNDRHSATDLFLFRHQTQEQSAGDQQSRSGSDNRLSELLICFEKYKALLG